MYSAGIWPTVTELGWTGHAGIHSLGTHRVNIDHDYISGEIAVREEKGCSGVG